MSGGSYQYIYSRVRDAADEVRSRTGDWTDAPGQREARLWFADHLELVAKALHDVEWVDSSDYGPGDEVKAIEALREGCRPFAAGALGEAQRKAVEALDELRRQVARLPG